VKHIRVYLKPVEEAMLLELQKSNKLYRDAEVFLVQCIRNEYYKTFKKRGKL